MFLLLGAFVLFGVLVDVRSAFLSRNMTDLGVFLRAAWAVRAGTDLYDITDNNQWHYHYPPLLAIVLVPLAYPPAGSGGDFTTIPFALSAGMWYVLNLFWLAWSVHQLASILEDGVCDRQGRPLPSGCRRWWRLRVIPVLACLVPTGHTLMRGQVSLLLLALLSTMAATLYRGRSFRSGLWLAAAICLKIIPAFLLLLPLWRRDGRFLGGCVLGLAIGLGVIPAAVFGIPQTLRYYEDYTRKVLRPGLGDDADRSRAHELTAVTATDSQSLLAILHNATYLDRTTRPAQASSTHRRLHWLGGGLLTIATLLAAGWLSGTRVAAEESLEPRSPLAAVLLFGALLFNMLLLSPVCHLHYFCLCIPLVMGLLAASWERTESTRLEFPLLLLLAGNFLAGLMPALPGLEVVRDLGLAAFGAFTLWLAACAVLWKQTRPVL